jgi:hypothetical protein
VIVDKEITLMAKKSRRPNLPQETLARARAEMYGMSVVDATEKTDKPPPARSGEAVPRPAARQKVVRVVDLAQDYAYVISDLEKVAMLAAVLMAVLVVMSFFI